MSKFKFILNIQLFVATRIADVIVPEVFNPYVIQETVRLDAFVQSGIVENNSMFDKLASTGGIILNMPFWNDLTGDSEELSDVVPLTVNPITSGRDAARLHMRGKAWGANDLAADLSGDDPMKVIASKVAKFWVGERQKTLRNSLTGLFNAANMAVNVLDISALVAPANNISASATLTAKQLMGDNADKLTAIAMHSAVFTYLQQLGLIVPGSEFNDPGFSYYLGYRVIVDDGLVPVVDVYTTYLFGAGAFGLGNGGAKTPTETDRDSLQGDDILVNRQHYIMHPRGVRWLEAAVVGETPTFLEMANLANWSRVYDPKNVRMVQFKHKINQ